MEFVLGVEIGFGIWDWDFLVGWLLVDYGEEGKVCGVDGMGWDGEVECVWIDRFFDGFIE